MSDSPAQTPQLGLVLAPLRPDAGGPRLLTFAEAAAIVCEAEAAGFHSVWLPDHFVMRRADGTVQQQLECWTLLAALAARTRRIKLGTLVLCNGFRHPALLAKQAATLQEISGGRVLLGLGAGWYEPEHRALGLPFDRRIGRLEESAAILRELLETGTSSYRGRWFRLDNAVLFPRPSTPVPLWIAATSPRSLRLAARLADGWHGGWCGPSPQPFEELNATLSAEATAAGRSPDAIRRAIGVQVQVAPPDGAGRAATAIARGHPELVTLPERWPAPGLAGLLRRTPALRCRIEREKLLRQVVVGDAAGVARALQRFACAGAELIVLSPPGHSVFPADYGALRRLLHDLPRALADLAHAGAQAAPALSGGG
jgi:probable F420-dependent oxidoreductase